MTKVGFPQTLEERDRKSLMVKEQLMREQRFLRRRLHHLDGVVPPSLKRRSVSECSSSSSRSSTSETGQYACLLCGLPPLLGAYLLRTCPLQKAAN